MELRVIVMSHLLFVSRKWGKLHQKCKFRILKHCDTTCKMHSSIDRYHSTLQHSAHSDPICCFHHSVWIEERRLCGASYL